MKPPTLLPCIEGIRSESVASNANSIILHLSAVALSSYCPLCGHLSQRIHSHYSRTLADLPWNRVAVRIHLKARKFYCDTPTCQRRIFTEPLPELAARYARKTNRLHDALYLIGYALGGEAGARVAIGLGLCVSPDTLLNRIRQVASRSSNHSGVRVLGVDDWAYRRGQRYGTLLVDLEKHRLLDLLPDRTSDSLADWLKAHPEIEIVSRDRAGAYVEGTRTGAPQAQQVADRFHLLQNLVDALQRLLLRHHKSLTEASKQVRVPATIEKATSTPPPAIEGVERRPTTQEQQRQQRKERRHARFEQVQEWHRQGVSIHQIARNLKMHRRTVRQLIRATELPERSPPRRHPSQLDRYQDYLRERWEAGCHNAAQLYRELKEQGFTGCQSALRHYLLSWRETLPEELRDRRSCKTGPPPVPVNFSARTTAWLLLGYAKTRDTAQQEVNEAFLTTLITLCPEVAEAQELAQAFFTLVREGKGTDLKVWIEKASSSDLTEFQSFARGLSADYDAVLAGIVEPWSNGQVEGQVHRLKLIKRSMYGRAKFDLLKARVLPMAKSA